MQHLPDSHTLTFVTHTLTFVTHTLTFVATVTAAAAAAFITGDNCCVWLWRCLHCRCRWY
jgi:hypothetical protein